MEFISLGPDPDHTMKRAVDSRFLVQCPVCHKIRSLSYNGYYACRQKGRTACVACNTGVPIKPIQDIPGQVIIIDPFYEPSTSQGSWLALVQCPECGKQFLRDRSNARKGTMCTSCDRTGDRNPNWRGGYNNRRKRDWYEVRPCVIERDGYTCQFPDCEVTERLEVHHIIPWRLTQDHNERNLISLCPHHHRWADNHLDKSIPMFDAIISAIYEGW